MGDSSSSSSSMLVMLGGGGAEEEEEAGISRKASPIQVERHQRSFRRASSSFSGSSLQMSQQQTLITHPTVTVAHSATTNQSRRNMKVSGRCRLVVPVLVACTVLLSIRLCTCDTKTTKNNHHNAHRHHHNQLVSPLVVASMVGHKQLPLATTKTRPFTTTTSAPETHSNKVANTQEDIEMQHFKTKPASRVFVKNRRPSKFDSGSLVVDLGPLGLRNPAKLSSIKKVDDSMRHILRMHENALLQQASSSGPAPSPTTTTTTTTINSHQHQHQHQQQVSGSGSNLLAKPVFGAAKNHLKRLRVISRSPVQVASSLIQRPNRVVSHMLSYISAQPVGAAKLFDLVTSSMLDGRTNLSALSAKLKFPPFEGRSNQNLPSLADKYTIGPLRLPKVTVYPLVSTLLKPSLISQLGSGTQSASTSSLLQPGKEVISSQIKSSLIGEDSDEIKNLMADSSSLSQLVASSGGAEANLIPRGSEASQPAPASGESSNASGENSSKPETTKSPTKSSPQKSSKLPWFKGTGNQLAQSYLQNSFRDLIMLSQLPILSASHISTAPSVLEKKQHSATKNKNNKNKNTKLLLTDDFRKRAMEELYRYAYILATGVRNKKDPLKALSSKLGLKEFNLYQRRKGKEPSAPAISQRSLNHLFNSAISNNSSQQLINMAKRFRSVLAAAGPLSRARPRGVVWDLATDPSLAVTIFHLLERARVALPLGFMLMPIVQMMRHPLNGINLGRILPPRASHRSVDYEELAKRLDVADKLLSRALRSTHRELVIGK